MVGVAPAATLVFTGVVLVVALLSELNNAGLTMGTISVPESLRVRGYTPDAIGRKIGDAYRRIFVEARTSMQLETVSVTNGEIYLATDNASVYALAVKALRFLRISNWREVSGEVTQNSAGQVSLTLRLDGESLTSKSIGPTDTPEELLEPAAVAILRRVQPYVVASWLHRRDSEAGRLAALELVRSLPASDPNSIRAHVLLGVIYQERGQTDLAIREYQTAMRLDSRDAASHNNLAGIYKEGGETDRAIKEYQIAIRLDPKLAMPHNNLGVILEERGMREVAIREYRTAARLDPNNPTPHYNLARALINEAESLEEGVAKQDVLTDACFHAVIGSTLEPGRPQYKTLLAILNNHVSCVSE